jgi:ubiquinone/menaquinone biosynthesis C-methylase UbiE
MAIESKDINKPDESELFVFKNDPTFAQLWDKCVYNLLYNIADYKKDIEKLFDQLGITKESKIVDVSAGGGFPSLDLIKDGYDITCVDGFQDQVDLFNEKAENSALDARCINSRWDNLGDIFEENSFDFLFCRGNSFIYAGGGWNEMIEINLNKSIKDYKKTLAIFCKLLKPGGWIYIDKFKDTETSHKEKVGQVQAGDGPKEELIFWTQRYSDKKIRQASMIRKIGDVESGVPNITYDLLGEELENMMKEVGLRNIQKIDLASEEHFDIRIAQK